MQLLVINCSSFSHEELFKMALANFLNCCQTSITIKKYCIRTTPVLMFCMTFSKNNGVVRAVYIIFSPNISCSLVLMFFCFFFTCMCTFDVINFYTLFIGLNFHVRYCFRHLYLCRCIFIHFKIQSFFPLDRL